MFNLTEHELQNKMAGFTAQEINQQPEVWKETVTTLFENKESMRGFIESIFSKHDHVRVLLTGAGTSAFAGDILVPELQKQYQGNVQFEAIATTDIVSNPSHYLFKDIPTILVSFARSGNSPESVAAVQLAGSIISDFYQVVITCNPHGELAKSTEQDANSLTILTPEQAHDQGFAMTSSFTSMMLACYGLFTVYPFTGDNVSKVIANGGKLVNQLTPVVEDILQFDIKRIVYLGSGLLSQLSHEAALKMLELTAGKVVAVHESSLGFRHGPKSILNDDTIVVLFMSQNPHTRRYDLDMLKELSGEDSKMKIVAVTEKTDSEIEGYADWVIPVNSDSEQLTNDFYLGLLYIMFAQVLALKMSIKLGITPDNPSPDGRVNRVVQGVTIYEYNHA